MNQRNIRLLRVDYLTTIKLDSKMYCTNLIVQCKYTNLIIDVVWESNKFHSNT